MEFSSLILHNQGRKMPKAGKKNHILGNFFPRVRKKRENWKGIRYRRKERVVSFAPLAHLDIYNNDCIFQQIFFSTKNKNDNQDNITGLPLILASLFLAILSKKSKPAARSTASGGTCKKQQYHKKQRILHQTRK